MTITPVYTKNLTDPSSVNSEVALANLLYAGGSFVIGGFIPDPGGNEYAGTSWSIEMGPK